jgi:hypothetical protein
MTGSLRKTCAGSEKIVVDVKELILEWQAELGKTLIRPGQPPLVFPCAGVSFVELSGQGAILDARAVRLQ